MCVDVCACRQHVTLAAWPICPSWLRQQQHQHHHHPQQQQLERLRGPATIMCFTSRARIVAAPSMDRWVASLVCQTSTPKQARIQGAQGLRLRSQKLSPKKLPKLSRNWNAHGVVRLQRGVYNYRISPRQRDNMR